MTVAMDTSTFTLRSERNPPTFIVARRGSGKTALLLSREFDPRNCRRSKGKP